MLLREYLRARCLQYMNAKQDLLEINSLILKVFHPGWLEQVLFLVPCELPKSFPLLLLGDSLLSRVEFPCTHELICP